jgi:hypothetical protein
MQHILYAVQRALSQGENAALQNGPNLTEPNPVSGSAESPQGLTIPKRSAINMLFPSGLREQP